MDEPLVNGQGSNGLLAKMDTFRKSDDERQQLWGDLVKLLEENHTTIRQLQDDYDNERMSRTEWQGRARQSERQLNIIKLQNDTAPFALVLIDGDGVLFQDQLLRSGAGGGSEAAYVLYNALKEQLVDRDSAAANWSIMVQIYCNFEDLSRKLASVGILNNSGELHEFARAFSLNQPLFSFIDVGRGKERADHKIKETFRLFVHNNQCKQIIFGGCHDNGYLPNLEQYKHDDIIASRITLLESTPAEWQYKNLGFPVYRFPNILRTDPLPSSMSLPLRTAPAPMSSHSSNFSANSRPFSPTNSLPSAQAARPTNSTSPLSTTTPAPKPGSPSNYATVSRTNGASVINIAPAKGPSKRTYALVNKAHQRLDLPLPRATLAGEQGLLSRIRIGGKVCNNFHLLNKCGNGSNCKYQHGERLSPAEQAALRLKARTTTCASETCTDAGCYLGHMCPNPTCTRGDCYFGATHASDGFDMVPYLKYYEDGEVEVCVN